MRWSFVLSSNATRGDFDIYLFTCDKKKDQLNTWVDVFDYFPSSQKITDLVTTFETDTFIERVMRSLDPYVFNYVK